MEYRVFYPALYFFGQSGTFLLYCMILHFR